VTKRIVVGNRKPLVEDILFIEGITRSGKFLLANVLSGFHGVEPVQNCRLLEMLPVFARFHLVDKKLAAEILRCDIDIHCYEMLIGRNLNHRVSDKSAIFKHPRYREFLKRCSMPDGDSALARFYEEKPCSLFVMHETMPNIDVYFDLFRKLKIIHMKRGPMELVFSLYKRGGGRRLNSDPRYWMIPFEERKKLFPWYVYPHQKKYFEHSEMDKVALRVINLFTMYKKKFATLPKAYTKRILMVSYENLLLEPKKMVNAIASFLGKKPSLQMPAILRREHLPNHAHLSKESEKISEIKKLVSSEHFNILLKLQKEYEQYLSVELGGL